MALNFQLLLQSACTSMCGHIYDWNIVKCDVKQPNSPHLEPYKCVIFAQTTKIDTHENKAIHSISIVISWLCGQLSNYCPEVVEKIWETVARGRGQQFQRSFPLPRDNGLTVPQVALTSLFYYPIVLNHRNTVNRMPMLVVDVETFDVSWRHLSCDQSIDRSIVFWRIVAIAIERKSW